MRVMIAGAGSVGRSIGRELLSHGHQVLLVERNPRAMRPERLPEAEWFLADACEISAMEEANLADCDVVVSATGDDKANLILSLLAKTEFGVPRTVGRVNNPKNEWLFTDSWGVDVAVSTPRLMTALVEEAVEVGDLVHLLSFQQSGVSMQEFTLPETSPLVGKTAGHVQWPAQTVLAVILRDGTPIPPTRDDVLEAGDELLFVTVPDSEAALRAQLAP